MTTEATTKQDRLEQLRKAQTEAIRQREALTQDILIRRGRILELEQQVAETPTPATTESPDG